MSHIDFMQLAPKSSEKWECFDTRDGWKDARRINSKAKTMLKRMERAVDDAQPWGCVGKLIDIAERFAWETMRCYPEWFGNGGGLDTEPRNHVFVFAENALRLAGIDWRIVL